MFEPAAACAVFAHLVSTFAGTDLQPTTSGASFGIFTDAVSSFMQSNTDTKPFHRHDEPSALPEQASSLQAWHPSQRVSGHTRPSSSQWQASQGSMEQPWPNSRHGQATQGSINLPWPTSPQWAQSPAHEPLTNWSNPRSGLPTSQLPLDIHSLSNGNLLTSSSPMQMPTTQSHSHVYSNGNQQVMQEHPLSLEAGPQAKIDGDDANDEGFGDFAAADHASHRTPHVLAAPTLQPADRYDLTDL